MNSNALNTNMSERISILRYIMIVGIVILHIPPYLTLTETEAGLFPFVKAFFSNAVFRSSVPVLTCISGYLLFSAGMDQKFNKLIRKKTRTLLVPLIVWNFPLVIALYFIQSKGIISHSFSANVYPFSIWNWLNYTFGITVTPVNYPLNFLRDLFVLALLSPLLGIALRSFPWLGLLIVAIIFLPNYDGILILRSTMPINFYIGGMAAIFVWNLTKLDFFAVPFLIIFIVACLLIVSFQIEDRRWFRLMSPFLIWPFSAVIIKHSVGKFIVKRSRHSFFIFLSHGPILLLTWLLYQKYMEEWVPYEIYWLLAPVLVVTFAQIVHISLKKHIPRVARIVLGSR